MAERVDERRSDGGRDEVLEEAVGRSREIGDAGREESECRRRSGKEARRKREDKDRERGEREDKRDESEDGSDDVYEYAGGIEGVAVALQRPGRHRYRDRCRKSESGGGGRADRVFRESTRLADEFIG